MIRPGRVPLAETGAVSPFIAMAAPSTAARVHGRTTRPPEPRPRLWLDIGLHEGPGMIGGARALRDALAARGWSGTKLVYAEDPEGRHDELSWAERVPAMLQFLFPPHPEDRP